MLDSLNGRLCEAEDELVPLRPIPELVAEHARRFDRMREDFRTGDEALHRRLDEITTDIKDLRDLCGSRFEQLHREQLALPREVAREGWRSNLTLFITVASGLGIPVGLAIFAALTA